MIRLLGFNNPNSRTKIKGRYTYEKESDSGNLCYSGDWIVITFIRSCSNK